MLACNLLPTILVLIFGTNNCIGWIRFREPPSRRNYLKLTPLQKLQSCGVNRECGVCGERPSEPRTQSISSANYTIVDPSQRLLGVEVGFRSDLNGYLEFRICAISDNFTYDAVTCNNTTPLLIGEESRWFPAEGQSFAESRFRLPPDLVCERCVLQVKYTPGNESTMKDFRFYDCAMLNITKLREKMADDNRAHLIISHSSTGTQEQTTQKRNQTSDGMNFGLTAATGTSAAVIRTASDHLSTIRDSERRGTFPSHHSVIDRQSGHSETKTGTELVDSLDLLQSIKSSFNFGRTGSRVQSGLNEVRGKGISETRAEVGVMPTRITDNLFTIPDISRGNRNNIRRSGIEVNTTNRSGKSLTNTSSLRDVSIQTADTDILSRDSVAEIVGSDVTGKAETRISNDNGQLQNIGSSDLTDRAVLVNTKLVKADTLGSSLGTMGDRTISITSIDIVKNKNIGSMNPNNQVESANVGEVGNFQRSEARDVINTINSEQEAAANAGSGEERVGNRRGRITLIEVVKGRNIANTDQNIVESKTRNSKNTLNRNILGNVTVVEGTTDTSNSPGTNIRTEAGNENISRAFGRNTVNVRNSNSSRENGIIKELFVGSNSNNFASAIKGHGTVTSDQGATVKEASTSKLADRNAISGLLGNVDASLISRVITREHMKSTDNLQKAKGSVNNPANITETFHIESNVISNTTTVNETLSNNDDTFVYYDDEFYWDYYNDTSFAYNETYDNLTGTDILTSESLDVLINATDMSRLDSQITSVLINKTASISEYVDGVNDTSILSTNDTAVGATNLSDIAASLMYEGTGELADTTAATDSVLVYNTVENNQSQVLQSNQLDSSVNGSTLIQTIVNVPAELIGKVNESSRNIINTGELTRLSINRWMILNNTGQGLLYGELNNSSVSGWGEYAGQNENVGSLINSTDIIDWVDIRQQKNNSFKNDLPLKQPVTNDTQVVQWVDIRTPKVSTEKARADMTIDTNKSLVNWVDIRTAKNLTEYTTTRLPDIHVDESKTKTASVEKSQDLIGVVRINKPPLNDTGTRKWVDIRTPKTKTGIERTVDLVVNHTDIVNWIDIRSRNNKSNVSVTSKPAVNNANVIRWLDIRTVKDSANQIHTNELGATTFESTNASLSDNINKIERQNVLLDENTFQQNDTFNSVVKSAKDRQITVNTKTFVSPTLPLIPSTRPTQFVSRVTTSLPTSGSTPSLSARKPFLEMNDHAQNTAIPFGPTRGFGSAQDMISNAYDSFTTHNDVPANTQISTVTESASYYDINTRAYDPYIGIPSTTENPTDQTGNVFIRTVNYSSASDMETVFPSLKQDVSLASISAATPTRETRRSSTEFVSLFSTTISPIVSEKSSTNDRSEVNFSQLDNANFLIDSDLKVDTLGGVPVQNDKNQDLLLNKTFGQSVSSDLLRDWLQNTSNQVNITYQLKADMYNLNDGNGSLFQTDRAGLRFYVVPVYIPAPVDDTKTQLVGNDFVLSDLTRSESNKAGGESLQRLRSGETVIGRNLIGHLGVQVVDSVANRLNINSAGINEGKRRDLQANDAVTERAGLLDIQPKVIWAVMNMTQNSGNSLSSVEKSRSKSSTLQDSEVLTNETHNTIDTEPTIITIATDFKTDPSANVDNLSTVTRTVYIKNTNNVSSQTNRQNANIISSQPNNKNADTDIAVTRNESWSIDVSTGQNSQNKETDVALAADAIVVDGLSSKATSQVAGQNVFLTEDEVLSRNISLTESKQNTNMDATLTGNVVIHNNIISGTSNQITNDNLENRNEVMDNYKYSHLNNQTTNIDQTSATTGVLGTELPLDKGVQNSIMDITLNGDASLNKINILSSRTDATRLDAEVPKAPNEMPPILLTVTTKDRANDRVPVYIRLFDPYMNTSSQSFDQSENITGKDTAEKINNKTANFSETSLWDINRLNDYEVEVKTLNESQVTVAEVPINYNEYKRIELFEVSPNLLKSDSDMSSGVNKYSVSKILQALTLELEALKYRNNAKRNRQVSGRSRTSHNSSEMNTRDTVNMLRQFLINNRTKVWSYPLFEIINGSKVISSEIKEVGGVHSTLLDDSRDKDLRGSQLYRLMNIRGQRGQRIWNWADSINTHVNSQLPVSQRGLNQAVIAFDGLGSKPSSLIDTLLESFSNSSNMKLSKNETRLDVRTNFEQPSQISQEAIQTIVVTDKRNDLNHENNTLVQSSNKEQLLINPIDLRSDMPSLESDINFFKTANDSGADKFIARGVGNLRHVLGVSDTPRNMAPPEIRTGEFNFIRRLPADNTIAIEGKYFVGQMRRNEFGQFEPVPIASKFDRASLAVAEKSGPFSSNTAPTFVTDTTESYFSNTNIPTVTMDSTAYATSESLPLEGALNMDNQGLTTGQPNKFQVRQAATTSKQSEFYDSAIGKARLSEPEISGSKDSFSTATNNKAWAETTISDMTPQESRSAQDNQYFYSQEELLRKLGIVLTGYETTDSAVTHNIENKIVGHKQENRNVGRCEQSELFICRAVGRNQYIPGMVWWCFEECRNNASCPTDTCDCKCRNVTVKAIDARSQTAVSNSPRTVDTDNRKKEKTVINLTLNGSVESRIPVRGKKLSQLRKRVSLTSSGPSVAINNVNVLQTTNTRQ